MNDIKILDKTVAETIEEYVGKAVVCEKQHEIVQKLSIDFFKRIVLLLEQKKYEELLQLTFESPSGDGYGVDSTCIDMNKMMDLGDVYFDFGYLLDILTSLKNREKMFHQMILK